MRHLTCLEGACHNDSIATYPSQKSPCQMATYCNSWGEWMEWSLCSQLCGSAKGRTQSLTFQITPW